MAATRHLTPQESTPDTRRELDHRNADGIDVRLLWDPQTNQTYISLIDERFGAKVEYAIDTAHAADAFVHPYAYS